MDKNFWTEVGKPLRELVTDLEKHLSNDKLDRVRRNAAKKTMEKIKKNLDKSEEIYKI